MAIKDKDGTVYKLRGPNPLVKNMADWDRTKVELINLGYKSEIVTDERNPIKAAKENVLDIGKQLKLEVPAETRSVPVQEFIQEIAEEPIVTQEPEQEPEEPQPVVLEVDESAALLLKKRGVEYNCLPAIGTKTHEDEFYGNSYQTTIYGTAFIFDAIIVDESDLELQFWGVRPITKGSIVYRRVKTGERWWRVDSVEPKTNGYLCIAHSSELSPDFS